MLSSQTYILLRGYLVSSYNKTIFNRTQNEFSSYHVDYAGNYWRYLAA